MTSIHFPPVNASIELQGEGASFPRSAYNAWIESYRATRSNQEDVRIQYRPTGSGNGRKAIISGVDTDFAGSDSILSDREQAENPDLVMIPTLAGAVVLAYNIPECDKQTLMLARSHVVGIFNGTITNWADPSLKELNPKCELPNTTIIVIARRDKSGTTKTFTSALSAFDANWDSEIGSFSEGMDENTKKPVKWDPDVIKYFGPNNEDVRGLLRTFDYSISYLSQADVINTKIKYAYIRNSRGQFVLPEQSTIRAAMNSRANETTLTPNLIDPEFDNSYPIASFTYLIFYKTEMQDCVKAKELVRFFLWCIESKLAEEDADSKGMVSLSQTMSRRVRRDVLEEVTCRGSNVLDQVLADIRREGETEDTNWQLPVGIATPIVILLIGSLFGYIVHQRLKLHKMLVNNDWDIPIDDIVFYFDEKAAGGSSIARSRFLRHRSIRSLKSIGEISEGDELLRHILQWPGKWRTFTVGIRLIDFKEFRLVSRDMKKTMIWMRDHMINSHLVRFYGMTELEKDRYIIGDFCNKGTILDILQNSKYNLNNEVKSAFALEIATGMAFLHLQGCVHGMLMSSCCLLDNKWTVRISDWEFNKLLLTQNPHQNPLHSMRASKGNAGSVIKDFWTAPEILRSEFEDFPTSASDVYSFAIILQELFTREEPYFEHQDLMETDEIVQAIVFNRLRPEPTMDTPITVRQVMEIAWSDTPAARPNFDQITKMLRRGRTERRSIMDNMMENMEEYAAHLEDEMEAKESALVSVKNSLDTLLNEMVPSHISMQVTSGRKVDSTIFPALGVVMAEVVNWPMLIDMKMLNNVLAFLDSFSLQMQKLTNKYKAYSPYHQSYEAQTHVLGLPTKHTVGDEVTAGGDQSPWVAHLALDIVKLSDTIKKETGLSILQLRISAHVGAVATGTIGQTAPKFLMIGNGIDVSKALLGNADPGSIRTSRALHTALGNDPGFEFEKGEPKWINCNGREIESYVLTGRQHDSALFHSDISGDSGVDVEVKPSGSISTDVALPQTSDKTQAITALNRSDSNSSDKSSRKQSATSSNTKSGKRPQFLQTRLDRKEGTGSGKVKSSNRVMRSQSLKIHNRGDFGNRLQSETTMTHSYFNQTLTSISEISDVAVDEKGSAGSLRLLAEELKNGNSGSGMKRVQSDTNLYVMAKEGDNHSSRDSGSMAKYRLEHEVSPVSAKGKQSHSKEKETKTTSSVSESSTKSNQHRKKESKTLSPSSSSPLSSPSSSSANLKKVQTDNAESSNVLISSPPYRRKTDTGVASTEKITDESAEQISVSGPSLSDSTHILGDSELKDAGCSGTAAIDSLSASSSVKHRKKRRKDRSKSNSRKGNGEQNQLKNEKEEIENNETMSNMTSDECAAQNDKPVELNSDSANEKGSVGNGAGLLGNDNATHGFNESKEASHCDVDVELGLSREVTSPSTSSGSRNDTDSKRRTRRAKRENKIHPEA